MAINVFGITWDSIESLIFFPLFLLLIGLLVVRYQRINQQLKQLATPQWRDTLFRGYSPLRTKIKLVLWIVALLFVFLALLHPQWGKREEHVQQKGRDLFVALDISRSMLAQDCKPNRLECAKEKINYLVNQLPSDRVGLMLFAGSALVQCPFTRDIAAFKMFLDAVDEYTISSGTTALDQVIAQSIEQFDRDTSRKSKLLVIFTDGEDFSQNLASIKAKAAEKGIHIFTIGIGTPQGAPIPIIDESGNQRGVEKDEQGDVVISRLNDGILQTLSHDTGGMYIRSTSDNNDDMLELVAQVERFEKEEMDEKKVSHFIERYNYFISVSFLCLLLEWLL